MTYRTLDDLDLQDKRVLVRVDLNVPLDEGEIGDDTRVRGIVPTVRDIVARGGRPILLSHFGRPKGKVRPEMSLERLIPPLRDLLGFDVAFAGDCTSDQAVEATRALTDGKVLLVENTRFHPGEEANDPAFADTLARLGDVFVMDAFSTAHRAHASTEGVAHRLPSAAGRLMQAELQALERALTSPQRPVVAVVGGSKVSTKIDLLSNLAEHTDAIVIGGGMANTFLAAKGVGIGRSLHEAQLLGTAREIMRKAGNTGCRLILPKDAVVAPRLKAGVRTDTVMVDEVPADAMILDIGPVTVEAIVQTFREARTLVWNGPLGAFEVEPFNAGTDACAGEAAALTEAGRLVSVAGGGDTVSALNRSGATDRFTYVSTAGGAFLEWLEGKTLPGVAALG